MEFKATPSGNRGSRKRMRMNALSRLIMRTMERWHRRKGDRFMGMDVLYLTTIGARTGQERRTPIARFAEEKGWLVVASLAGSALNPGWYHNIAAHPGQVWAEVGGVRFRVIPEQLEGEERAAAWRRIADEQPRYAEYQAKTDREIPVLRLTPAD